VPSILARGERNFEQGANRIRQEWKTTRRTTNTAKKREKGKQSSTKAEE